MKKIEYFSLFTGIGGFELGIQQAYETILFKCDKLRTQQRKRDKDKKAISNSKLIGSKAINKYSPTCVGYSEIDKYAIQIFEKHFPGIKNYGDITKINVQEIPEIDLLVGGFPCQSFSIAGKRGGFEDTRGTLFFEIARIAKAKRPRLLWLENVKGLLSHDEGNTFATIIATLDELGYDCQWQVLNSKNFGVPQNRERVFIIGHLRGTSRPKVFPIGEDDKRVNEKNGRKRISSATVTTRTGNTPRGQQFLIQDKRQSGEVRLKKDISPAVSAYWGLGGGNVPIMISNKVALREVRTDEAKKIRSKMMKGGKDWSPRRGKRLEPRKDNLSNTVTAQQGVEQLIKDLDFEDEDLSIRRLTPTECERLQGFPDGWTEGLSDTQRYKTLGNAVTVNVIKEIAKKLFNEN